MAHHSQLFAYFTSHNHLKSWDGGDDINGKRYHDIYLVMKVMNLVLVLVMMITMMIMMMMMVDDDDDIDDGVDDNDDTNDDDNSVANTDVDFNGVNTDDTN